MITFVHPTNTQLDYAPGSIVYGYAILVPRFSFPALSHGTGSSTTVHLPGTRASFRNHKLGWVIIVASWDTYKLRWCSQLSSSFAFNHHLGAATIGEICSQFVQIFLISEFCMMMRRRSVTTWQIQQRERKTYQERLVFTYLEAISQKSRINKKCAKKNTENLEI